MNKLFNNFRKTSQNRYNVVLLACRASCLSGSCYTLILGSLLYFTESVVILEKQLLRCFFKFFKFYNSSHALSI